MSCELATKRPHVANNSGNNEWYTPPHILAAAREVMGGIDLDPASSEQANRAVGAARFFTKDDDGLTRRWSGRVWLNPPYGRGLIAPFITKLCEHYAAGDVCEAIVLVNNATESKWFQELLSRSSAACFLAGRVKYLAPDGVKNTPLQGQVILYIGNRPEAFAFRFSDYGIVLH